MRPYYFDFDAPRTRRAQAILTFEKAARCGRRPPPHSRTLADILGSAVALVLRWHRRVRERSELANLDTRMLRDIGITPGEAGHECNKPFWRP